MHRGILVVVEHDNEPDFKYGWYIQCDAFGIVITSTGLFTEDGASEDARRVASKFGIDVDRLYCELCSDNALAAFEIDCLEPDGVTKQPTKRVCGKCLTSGIGSMRYSIRRITEQGE